MKKKNKKAVENLMAKKMYRTSILQPLLDQPEEEKIKHIIIGSLEDSDAEDEV